MIRINLLPVAERRPDIPYGRVALFFVSLFILLLGSIFAVEVFLTRSVEQDLAEARARFEELRPVRDAMAQAGDKQKRIDAKVALVNEVAKTRTNPYNLFPRIALVLPEAVWLDETRVNRDDGKVELKGAAVSYPELAQFISNLEADGIYSSVTVKSTEGDFKAGTMKFTLEVKLK